MPPRAAAAGPKKKGPAVHKLPETIREGEILKDIQKRSWRIGKSIGVGGFGEIYAASDDVDRPVGPDAAYVIKIEPHSNGPLFVEMNFYIRVAKGEMIDEWTKSHKVKHLGMPRFIGSGSHDYRGEKYRFMVMQRFGTDIQKMFDSNNRQFNVRTVINLGLRIIDVLEYIHDKQYVHADIKGSNLLLGFGKGNENQVWLVDFGLACKYANAGVHKEYKPDVRKAHNGTIEFTSRDAHIGANSRRSDFEILAYNLLQWLCGRLPWEDKLTDCEYVAAQKNKYMANTNLLVQTCFNNNRKAPGFISRFLEAVAKLKFEEKPDYDKFRSILRQGLKDAGLADDGKLSFVGAATSIAKPVRGKVPSIVVHDDDEEPAGRKRSAARAAPSTEPDKVAKKVARKTLPSDSTDSDDSFGGPRRLGRAGLKSKAAPAKTAPVTTKLDAPVSNPTPAMMAVLARIRKRESMQTLTPVKKKQATDPDSDDGSELEILSPGMTPAMQDVIRVREIRKSMSMNMNMTEHSGFYFTASEPDDSLSSASSSRDRYKINDEEPEPRRKVSSGSASITDRVLRNKKVRELSESVASVDSSSSADACLSPLRSGVQRRKVKYVNVASASTQTSPGVLRLPPFRTPYGLRSNQASTPSTGSRKPPIIELSPDLFRS